MQDLKLTLNTNKMKTSVNTLKDQRAELVTALRSSYGASEMDTIAEQIRRVDAQIKTVKRAEMLSNHNAKQSKMRDLARIAWNCEQPTEDIFTNDGSPHKAKVKKYPNLAAVEYLRGKFKCGQLVEVSISGHSFQLGQFNYEYNKPDEFTRFGTFSEFLKHNSIQESDLSVTQFNAICNELADAEQKLNEAIKAYELKKSVLNVYSLSHWGLLRQTSPSLYTYEPNN